MAGAMVALMISTSSSVGFQPFVGPVPRFSIQIGNWHIDYSDFVEIGLLSSPRDIGIGG